VRGRWTFDAGHKGHNEIHAVLTIQKIPETDPTRPASPPPGAPQSDVDNFYRVWCDLADPAPPDHKPGQRPAGMTPEQTRTFDNQEAPENKYRIHPDIDGCISRLQPSIRSVEPSQINRELGDSELTITGSNFVQGATVTLHGPDVVVDGATVQSSSRIVATARIRPDTPTGPRDLMVSNPDGSSASIPGAVIVFDQPIIR
jgi:IPT/TIG domain